MSQHDPKRKGNARAHGPRGAADARMTLSQHLAELRRRLFWSAVAIAIGALGGYVASDFLLDLLRSPLKQVGGPNVALNFTDITGAFDLRIQIAITTGLIVASPVWVYQILAFIVPAMEKRGRRRTFAAVTGITPLFVGGAIAGAYVLPHIVVLMASFAQNGTSLFLDAKGYVDFALKLMLITGVAFVLPAVLVVANLAGVISGAAILRGWRLAAIGITGFTAIATPAADVLSMLLLALPMVVLYFAACAFSILHDRRAARALTAETHAEERITI